MFTIKGIGVEKILCKGHVPVGTLIGNKQACGKQGDGSVVTYVSRHVRLYHLGTHYYVRFCLLYVAIQ